MLSPRAPHALMFLTRRAPSFEVLCSVSVTMADTKLFEVCFVTKPCSTLCILNFKVFCLFFLLLFLFCWFFLFFFYSVFYQICHCPGGE